MLGIDSDGDGDTAASGVAPGGRGVAGRGDLAVPQLLDRPGGEAPGSGGGLGPGATISDRESPELGCGGQRPQTGGLRVAGGAARDDQRELGGRVRRAEPAEGSSAVCGGRIVAQNRRHAGQRGRLRSTGIEPGRGRVSAGAGGRTSDRGKPAPGRCDRRNVAARRSETGP